jgi:cyanate permease
MRLDDPSDLGRAVNCAGVLFVVVGALGLLFARSLLFLWVFLIAFGIVSLPRIAVSRLAARVRRARD